MTDELVAKTFTSITQLQSNIYKLIEGLTVHANDGFVYIPNITFDNVKQICFKLFEGNVLKDVTPPKEPLKLQYGQYKNCLKDPLKTFTVNTILTKDNIKEVLSK